MKKSALKLLEEIENEGYQAYLVGGCVRDILMYNEPKDYDIATNMPMELLIKKYNCIDISKGKDFGILQIKFNGYKFEVAQFRKEENYIDGRHPSDVSFNVTIEDDLSRRDFTINGLAMERNGIMIDLYNSFDDIVKYKIVKCIGDSFSRFEEDRIRILRGIRFASRYNFKIDLNTKNAMRAFSTTIFKRATEKILDEIFEIAKEEGIVFAKAIMIMEDVNILQQLFPEVYFLHNLPHNKEHHPEGDCFQHTIKTLELNKNKNKPLLNIALLLHDIGKSKCYSYKNQIHTYYGHDDEGVELLKEIKNRLKLSNDMYDSLEFVIKNHMKFFRIKEMKKIKVLNLINNKNWELLKEVALYDTLARCTDITLRENISFYNQILDYTENIKETWIPKNDQKIKLVSGNLIMELTNLQPGPKIGEIINIISDWILENNIKDQNEIINFIKNYKYD